MLKVCMVVSTLKESGPVNVVYNIIKGCAENEIEFHIISISKEPTNNLVNRFLKLSVIHKNLELTRFSSIFKGRNALKKYLKTKNINIIHFHGFRPNYLGFLIAKSYKTISTIHNNQRITIPICIYQLTSVPFNKPINSNICIMHVIIHEILFNHIAFIA